MFRWCLVIWVCVLLAGTVTIIVGIESKGPTSSWLILGGGLLLAIDAIIFILYIEGVIPTDPGEPSPPSSGGLTWGNGSFDDYPDDCK